LEYTPERISKRDARVKPSTFLADRVHSIHDFLLADFGYLAQGTRHLQFLMGPIPPIVVQTNMLEASPGTQDGSGRQTGCNSNESDLLD
jgi:hypothetical protein